MRKNFREAKWHNVFFVLNDFFHEQNKGSEGF